MTGAGNDKFREIDDEGIRLAPVPMTKSGAHVLPSVRQEFIIDTVLNVPETSGGAAVKVEPVTERDFQPVKTDKTRKWKAKERLKNVIPGLLIFAVSALVILPYILGLFNIKLDFIPFKYDLENYNAVNNVINAFKISSNLGWRGVGFVWAAAVPDILLSVGVLFIAINLINAVIGVFGGIKPRRYLPFTIPYLVAVLAVFIASLIGADAIGITKIDFMQDFIYGFRQSELFSLLVFAVGNFLTALILRMLRPTRSGYAA